MRPLAVVRHVVAFSILWLGSAAASERVLAPAAPAPALDRLVPAATPVFVSFPSPGASASAFRELPLYKTWADVEVQEFLKSVRTMAPRLLSQGAGPAVARVYELLGDFPEVFDRQIAVAWLDHRALTERWVAIAEGSDAKLVLERTALFERDVFAALFAETPRVTRHRDTEIRTYVSGGLELGVAVCGGAAIVGSPRSAVEGLLDAFHSPPAAPLASDASYRALRERTLADGSEMFFAAIDARGLIGAGLEGEPENNRRSAEAAGFLSLGRAGASVRSEGGFLRERISLEFPEGRRGLFAALSENANKAGVARLAPAESLGVFALNLKVRDLYATLLEIERASEGAYRLSASSVDSAMEKEVRLRLMGDFVELLGEEIGAYVSLPSSGGLIPEAGLFVEVLDAERFRRNLEELAAKTLKLEFRSTDFRGRKVHYLDPGRQNQFGLTFSYAVADPFLVVSYFPLNVKNALTRLDSASGTLASDAGFMATLAALPPERKGFFYVNTKRTVSYLYNFMSLLMQFDFGSDLPFDPAALPTVDALTRHLNQTTGTLSAESRAIVADVRSEGIGPASFLMYGALAGGLFSPMLVAEAAQSAESACQHRLHSLEWSTRGRESSDLTRALRDVFAERSADLRFDCPADAAPRDDGDGSIFSYVLAFPGADDAPPDLPAREVIVVYERAPHHRGGRYFLRLDGSVDFLPEEEFVRRLARQTEAASRR